MNIGRRAHLEFAPAQIEVEDLPGGRVHPALTDETKTVRREYLQLFDSLGSASAGPGSSC